MVRFHFQWQEARESVGILRDVAARHVLIKTELEK
jgi:hypothetical protein